MKTIKFFMLVLSCGIIFAQQKGKPLVAVLDLQVSGGLLKSEAQALSDRLRSEMEELKKFDLIERGQMDALLKEQDFALSDMSEASAAKAGKLLSVEQIVIGTIGKVGHSYTVDARLLDVETGRIIKSSKQDYAGPTEGLTQVVRNIARIFGDLPPKPVKISSNLGWWLTGSAALLGGGAAAAYVMMNKENKSGPKSFPTPPSLP